MPDLIRHPSGASKHDGSAKSKARTKALAALEQLQAPIQVLPLDDTVGVHYGDIRSALERSGTPVADP